jgi:acyl dehydratase
MGKPMEGSTETALVVDVMALSEHADADLGHTAWQTMDQARVDAFADVTEDHNPIHLDADFAAATPFGGTIAHGYLTLALVAPRLEELLRVENAAMSINYGLGKVRFPAPLPVGSRYRAAARLGAVEQAGPGFQIEVTVTIEVEDQPKPALVAECLFRHYP